MKDDANIHVLNISKPYFVILAIEWELINRDKLHTIINIPNYLNCVLFCYQLQIIVVAMQEYAAGVPPTQSTQSTLAPSALTCCSSYCHTNKETSFTKRTRCIIYPTRIFSSKSGLNEYKAWYRKIYWPFYMVTKNTEFSATITITLWSLKCQWIYINISQNKASYRAPFASNK